MTAPPERLERLGEKFRRFAVEAAAELGSPLWERVSLLVAEEPRLLAMADEARPGVQQPNMLLSALHYLLLDAPVPPRELLATMSDASIVSFMLGHEKEMRALIRERLVQTNEVRRCALLLPAFVRVAATAERPLAMVEVGTSAGLLLGFDRYGYTYEPHGLTAGDASAPVQLACELRGDRLPSVALEEVRAAGRVGIDLHPVRPDEAADVKWLRALVWPEHEDRQQRLTAALAMAANAPVELRAGDAFDLLPAAVREVPSGAVPVVFHCMTLAHMTPPQRQRFTEIVSALAAERRGELYWIAAEGNGVYLTTYSRTGEPSTVTVANMNPHGAWLEWLVD